MWYGASAILEKKTADAIGASAAQAALGRLKANPGANPRRLAKVQSRLQAEQAPAAGASPKPAPTAAPKPAGAVATPKSAPAGAVAAPKPAGASPGSTAMVPYTPPKAFASHAPGASPTDAPAGQALAQKQPGMGWGKGLALAGAGVVGLSMLNGLRDRDRES